MASHQHPNIGRPVRKNEIRRASSPIGTARHRGAAAIEFAFIFPLFFAILYATISYSLTLLLQMGMSNAAADGARTAIQLVDPLQLNQTEFNDATKQRITQAVKASLGWLSDAQVAAIVANIDITTSPDPGNGVGSAAGVRVNVRVQWKNYATSPLIRSIDLPFVGKVPPLPQNLTGSASMLLH
jgi:Flp pilus assembly protein TadG